MNAPRRLTALPLPLLRTTRRLTSSRFSPSGKSLPSSPLVLTTSRRIAPLPLLLIALLALGGVLLWSAPAEAQTETTLVRNLSQGNDDDASLSGNDHAQLFHTAPNTGSNTGGWVVTSVIVDSEDTAGDDFDVDICLAHDTTGFPTETCTDLQSRSDFTAGQLVFRAYFTGILLNANDNYTVVISQRGTGNVTLDSTTSGGEDSGSVAGWSIKDKFDWNNSGTWQQKSGANEALRIRIDGYERPGNRQPTGLPRVLPTGEDQGILYADTSRIADADGFVNIGSVDSTGIHHEFDYQWIRVDGNTETNIAGATSARYRRVEDDIGKHIKVEVSYTDRFGGAESVTSLPFGPVPAPAPSRPATTLVGNTGQTPASASSITSAYEMGFKLGTHGQGYEISSVSIDLTAAPSSLTVSLYAGGGPGLGTSGRTKLFDFENPDSFTVGLNEFTAPAGAFAYQNAQYFISLSGFGATLSINETTSDDEDAGGERGATLADEAGGDTNVLRMAVKGSKRTGGILAATYTQITGDQEIVSVGDLIGNEVFFGPEADRYLIRGLSFTMDDTTSRNGGFTNPWRMRSGSTTLFQMVSSRQVNGINEFTAPVGSTVAGRAGKYNLFVDIENFDRMGEVVLTRYSCTTSVSLDVPSVPGVRFGEDLEDFACPTPIMAILGDPLYAMAQNLGQTDSIFWTASATIPVFSQGFTTGPNAAGYRLQGIGVNIEGSDKSGTPQVPDGPTSVSVAVHADLNGKPGAKLFDLVSPTDYAPGHSFFEAPPGTKLDPDTSYVLVWRHLGGTGHRLQATLGNSEDSGALAGFSIADAANWGSDLVSQVEDATGNALEIAVYTNRDLSPPKRVTGFDLVSNNSAPRGVWGNEETIWVANDGSGATDKLYAYNRSDRSRDSSSDFDTLNTPGNNNPRGICSDGTTMFVADGGDDKIYAYKMSDTTRDSGKDVTLDSANNSPQGLSCDRTHLWVAEDNDDLTSKIFVYLRSNGSHVSTLDIGASTLSPSSTVGAINNNDQRGMWSNGTTLFVVDHGDTKVYGYKLSDQTRDDDKNLDLVSANASPWGLWFDGRVLWVADTADDKLYVYDLPGAQPGNTPADGVPEVRTSQDVWSATLTVKDIGSNFLGCDTMEANKGCEPVELLTDNTFSYDSVNYRIDSIYLQGGQLSLETSRNITAVALAALTLHVGGLSLPFEDATQSSTRLAWTSTGLSWSVNDTVSLRITGEAPPADGDELRADTSGITDDTDGLANVYYHYQWIRVDGTTVTELDGETGPTYTATADDVTKDIQVRVIFDDDVRNREYPRYSPQVTVREVPPVVTGVTLTSMPGSDDTYAIEDSVTATVTFDKAVDVTAGPQITLLVGTADKAADCAAATNTTTVECSYEVAANDTAPDGVGIKANTLTLNGGTIYSTGSTTNAATLTHLALALQSGHLVDGIRPTLVTTGNKSPRTSGDGDHIILTFSKNISAVDLAKINISAGNIPQATTAASATGTKVEIELTTPLTATSTTIIVELAVNAVKDAAGNGILAVGSTTVLNQVSAAPSAPTNLMAEPAPDETPQLAVDLSWTAPTSDGGSAITSHQYRYNRNSGSFGNWTTIDNSAANGANATSFTVKGLSAVNNALTTFEFEVRAINDNGNGAESDPAATATIDVPDNIALSMATVGNRQVTLTWSTPNNNGSAILRYQYWVYDNVTETFVVPENTTIPNSDADTTSFTITGLTNGVTYTVVIKAVNTVGAPDDDPGSYTPMAGPPGKPSVTVQSRVAALYVSWTLEDDGGSSITEYQVQWKSGAQSFDSSRQQAGLTGTNTLIETLINGTEYDVRVRAMNSINWGPWSDIDSGTPVEGPAVSVSAETLTIDEGGSGAYSVVITTEPTAPVSILISAGGDVTTQPNALVFTASNWNIWQKVAVNAAQDGDADDDTVTIHHHTNTFAQEYEELTDLPSVQVTVLDDDVPPPAVRGFIAVDESQDAIALSWWSERGAAEYELEYRKQGDTGAWTRVTRGDFDHLPSTTGNRSLTAIATGLECNTTYEFRIRLRGSGDLLLNAFGPHTQVSQKTGQCAQPDRPTNLMYTLAPDCATLTWTAPTAGDYTGVRIRRLTLGDDTYTVIHEDLNSRPTSYRDCTHTGDGYGDGGSPWYAYRVAYIKSGSRGIVESKPARSGLDQYGPAFQDHLHATPRNVRLTLDTDSQRTMTWDAPPSWSLTIWAGLQGASVPVPDPWITGYVVERREFRARADGYLYFPEPEDTPIWSATMTVGSSTTGTGSTGYYGIGSNTFGALTPSAFTHPLGSGNWEVTSLFVRPTGQSAGLKLTIQEVGTQSEDLLNSAFEDWVLVVDGRSFPFELLDAGIGGLQVSWANHGLSWSNGQQVSVQLVERELFEWERLRRGRDGDTSTSFTDNEQANGRKFVYRVMTANTRGTSTMHAIFDWLWDSPYRDAVVDLAATGTPPERTKPTLEEYPAATRSIPGNTPAGREVGAPLSATDADNDILFYSLGGPDAASFDLDASSGQLWTTAALAGSGRTSYSVSVSVSDGLDDLGNPENPPAIDATTVVTITVTTASTSGSGGGGGGGGGSGGGAIGGGGVPRNRSPSFTDGDATTRAVAENTAAGQDIGAPLEATGPDRRDTLTYTLEGEDAEFFDIDPATGQLRTKAPLDYETRTSYTLTARVEDPRGRSDVMEVTVEVTNVGLDGVAGRYDRDDNGAIDRDEVIAAVADYFNGVISKEEAIEVVRVYFAG